MPVFGDILQSVGRTPLIRINNLTRGITATVYAKIEGRNPSYSVKCRVGTAMIMEAEKEGLLGPGIGVVEATSGNTGMALAFVCASRGYRLRLVMPETMSQERRTMLKAYGAELLLTPGAEGMRGAVIRAEEIANEPGWYMPRQFENPANPRIHFQTTGPEIEQDTEGKLDAFICGVGTGGTITGVGQYFKYDRLRKLHIVAVEPAASPVLSGGPPGKHKIQGIGAGFIPKVLDRSVIDEVLTVTDEESIDMARRLMHEEGISCGISCGAAMVATLRVAARAEFKDKTIVTVLPDAAERYQSTSLFDGMAALPVASGSDLPLEPDPYLYDLGDG